MKRKLKYLVIGLLIYIMLTGSMMLLKMAKECINKSTEEIYLFDEPYLECDTPEEFETGKYALLTKVGFKNYDYKYSNFVGFNFNKPNNLNDGEECVYHNEVTYELNDAAKKAKGTLIPPAFSDANYAEYSVNFYDERGNLLYQSPVMEEFSSKVKFEFDIRKVEKLKIEFNGRSDCFIYNFICRINDLKIVIKD